MCLIGFSHSLNTHKSAFIALESPKKRIRRSSSISSKSQTSATVSSTIQKQLSNLLVSGAPTGCWDQWMEAEKEDVPSSPVVKSLPQKHVILQRQLFLSTKKEDPAETLFWMGPATGNLFCDIPESISIPSFSTPRENDSPSSSSCDGFWNECDLDDDVSELSDEDFGDCQELECLPRTIFSVVQHLLNDPKYDEKYLLGD